MLEKPPGITVYNRRPVTLQERVAVVWTHTLPGYAEYSAVGQLTTLSGHSVWSKIPSINFAPYDT